MSGDVRGDLRNDYEFVGGFWDSRDRCLRCRKPVETWTEDVPCCGPPYECVDTLYVYACHKCRIVGDSF